jgi:hypothetical protein
LAKLRSGEDEAGGVSGGQERGCTTGANRWETPWGRRFFSQDLKFPMIYQEIWRISEKPWESKSSKHDSEFASIWGFDRISFLKQ